MLKGLLEDPSHQTLAAQCFPEFFRRTRNTVLTEQLLFQSSEEPLLNSSFLDHGLSKTHVSLRYAKNQKNGYIRQGCKPKGLPRQDAIDYNFNYSGSNSSQPRIINFTIMRDTHGCHYYYFIRLMGRKASHVAVECTLQSHPNMVILAEEVAALKLTLFHISKQICDAVQARAGQGLTESIPEVFAQLQRVSTDNISAKLSPWASALFEFMPPFIRKQLLLHPESDDSAQLSQIENKKLLAELVEAEINMRLKEGTYKGKKFHAICHFFGYQACGSAILMHYRLFDSFSF
nr:pyrophosphate--fructose 6-phosphate 1-phosphotransferase subunit alpha 2 [Tanacetum cinerariifolium]